MTSFSHINIKIISQHTKIYCVRHVAVNKQFSNFVIEIIVIEMKYTKFLMSFGSTACMTPRTAEVLCFRSQNSFISISAWGTYRFLFMRQPFTFQDDGTEPAPLYARAQDLDCRATRARLMFLSWKPITPRQKLSALRLCFSFEIIVGIRAMTFCKWNHYFDQYLN